MTISVSYLRKPSTCTECAAPLDQHNGPGRPRQFCRAWCGVKYRRRWAQYLRPVGR